MQLNKALTAGAVGGIVMAIYDYLVHGMLLAGQYQAIEGFKQGEELGAPFWFPVVTIVMGLVAGILFAKTRGSWESGAKGGMMFGLWIGLLGGFAAFFSPLMIKGFPYAMAWYSLVVQVIGWMIYGAVAGSMYKVEETAAA